MCGRFSQAKELKELLKRFQAELAEELDFVPRYNIPPTTPDVIGIYLDRDRHRVARRMKWNLALPWMGEFQSRVLSILRVETLLNRRHYLELLHSSRCIIPVDGFYEWRDKKPYRFVSTDDDFLALGGVYSRTVGPDGKEDYSFALMTTDPNAAVAAVHDRQPVVITEAKERMWLDPLSKQHVFVECLGPSQASRMRGFAVNPKLNSAKNDSSDLIEPWNGEAG